MVHHLEVLPTGILRYIPNHVGGPCVLARSAALHSSLDIGEHNHTATIMLTEQIISSIGVPAKTPGTHIAKDSAIFIHEFQPVRTQRSVFKKSATLPQCLVFSQTHIFAAQADKAVVHVYDRERGNQTATVPFPERITCLALACDEAVLVLGTAEGRVFIWEVCTGRQITPSQTHLQAVTMMAVDPTSNFLLSASQDSTVHVWSIPALLSFSNTGGTALVRTFSSHHAEITCLLVGHGSRRANFAISASKDRTCLVWDYHNNNVLRTCLLPAVPLCITLDAADRAIYVGYEDGTVQQLDFFSSAAESASLDALQNANNAMTPIQPVDASRWRSPDKTHGATRSVTLSFDSCTLLSGHESGAILAWDVGRRALHSSVLQHPLPGPVNNLAFFPVTGFRNDTERRKIRTPVVVKPRFGAFDATEGVVPGSYAMQVELVGNLPSSNATGPSMFEQALTATTFPEALLDEGLTELASWNSVLSTNRTDVATENEDGFLALSNGPKESDFDQQIMALKAQNEALRRLQTASFEKIERLSQEKKAMLQRGRKRQELNGVNHSHEDDDESMESD